MKLTILLCALVLLAPVCVRADAAGLQQALTAAYSRECQALVAADSNAWAKVHASGYVGIHPDGTRDDLATAVKNTQQLFSFAKITDCTPVFSSVKQNGDDVVATLTLTINGTVAASGSGATQPLNIVVQAVDTWTQQNGVWLQKTSQASEQTVKVNGQVVQHNVAPAPAASPSP